MALDESGAKFLNTRHLARCRRITPDVPLLADAETPEYFAEQILAGEFPGDLPQSLLRQAQIFGEQFEGARVVQDVRSGLHVPPRAVQGIEMPAPCGERAGFGFAISGRVLQVTAQ